MRHVLQSVIRDRDNEMPYKGLSIKHQTFDYYKQLVFTFLAKPKEIVMYYSLSRSHIVVLTKRYQKN